MNNFNTPIAFLIFKRPDETSRVFEMIKKIKPKQLFIIADGPRNNEEKELTDKTRIVVENIDWQCEVKRDYSDRNLGCKIRVSSGINWVFNNVEKAIIIEDDCLPNESFFYFCQEMLSKYENNEKIMHISGINLLNKEQRKNINTSYYFSNIAQIWGWATWKRAWQKYDLKMHDWPKVKSDNVINNIFNNNQVTDYFNYLYQRMYDGVLDTWDVAWTYTCMKEKGLCIVPNVNMIQNIGFGNGATHSKSNKGYVGEMILYNMNFPLNHPQEIKVDKIADNIILKKVFSINSRFDQKLLWFLKSKFPFIYNKLRLIRSHF